MKLPTIIYSIAVFFLYVTFLSAGNRASDCNGYYATTKGTRGEMSEYDAGNTLIGKTNYEIIDSKRTGNKTIATVKNVHVDLKKNKTTDAQFDIECDEVNTTVNSIQLIQGNLKSSSQLSQSTASGNNPIVPNQLSVGQTLPESSIQISIKGEISLESKVKIYDRKVVQMETITVPAGSFECAVITYKEDDQILFNKTSKHKIWLSKRVGIVKSETYSKKGKLEKRSELSSFKK